MNVWLLRKGGAETNQDWSKIQDVLEKTHYKAYDLHINAQPESRAGNAPENPCPVVNSCPNRGRVASGTDRLGMPTWKHPPLGKNRKGCPLKWPGAVPGLDLRFAVLPDLVEKRKVRQAVGLKV